jgi:hypothetical protein
LIPFAIVVLAVGVPLQRSVQQGRDERAALEAVASVREAQDRFHRLSGGFATELTSLTTGCGGTPELSTQVLANLDRAGYTLQLRAAGSAIVVGRDCHGRLADDYYVAAAPRDASGARRQAFAARARGDMFLFYDGVAPREPEMSNGLATPAAQRGTFKIP